jgi:chromate transport protein ChrA
VWGLLGNAPWPKAIRNALLPIGLGLAAGGTLSLARGAIHSWLAVALAALTLAIVSGSRLNAVLVIIGCGLIAAILSAFGLT